MTPVPWERAWQEALYGARGFFRRPEGPAGHFRTSVHVSRQYGATLARLARAAGLDGVVDVGAGRGELLGAVHAADPALALLGVDVVGRPGGLPAAADWTSRLPDRLEGVLVIANEWLDDVPCAVVEARRRRWHLVLVDPGTGQEEVAGPVDGVAAAWLDRWWPPGRDGDRAEVGLARDEAWGDLLRRLSQGLAVAVDYGHVLAGRAAGEWAGGTLAGYRAGRAVAPVPDGSCDVTAHVALDACAAAGEAAGARTVTVTRQREALLALGVRGDPPPHDLASRDPAAYVQALARAGEAAELLDPRGLGGFTWLVQAVGLDGAALARLPLPH